MLFLWGCVSHDHPFPIGGAVPWGMPRQAERNPGSHLSGSRTRLAPPTATQRRSRQSALALTFPNHSITMGRDPASKARQGNIACRFGVSMPGFSRRNAAGKAQPGRACTGKGSSLCRANRHRGTVVSRFHPPRTRSADGQSNRRLSSPNAFALQAVPGTPNNLFP